MFKLLQTIIILFIINPANASIHSHDVTPPIIDSKLHAIEREHHLKVGVYALDTSSGHVIAYHANSRFPFQSTCKFIGVSALLAKNPHQQLLQKKIFIHPEDILFWHPISGKYVNQRVPLKTLAEGAISYSDNTATNMIIHELGGVKAINQFTRSIGNPSFKLAHYEINLNSNPDHEADTSTPKDMALSVQKILLGSALNEANRALLLEWMRNNTTGYHRIRAGVPLGWTVADKTGSGRYGVANDIGIAWSPACKPVVLSIFTFSSHSDAKPNDEAIADITRAIFKDFEQHNTCYQVTRLN